jgi:hypothetical protein
MPMTAFTVAGAACPQSSLKRTFLRYHPQSGGALDAPESS